MKNQYKKLTGNEYKPATAPAQKENQKPTSGASAASAQKESKKSTSEASTEAEQLVEKIAQQGNKVRELKSNKSSPQVSPMAKKHSTES